MSTSKVDRTAQLAALPVIPNEDPFVVANGGFYRRWFNLVDDIQPMLDTVPTLKATEDEDWVPPWTAVAERYEREGDAALAHGDRSAARNAYLHAKTYLRASHAFLRPTTPDRTSAPPRSAPSKAAAYERYLNCFRKATALIDNPPQTLVVERNGLKAVGHLRIPKQASTTNKVPAVLVMCGADMYKEDRERYANYALAEGMASVVVDAPGTGQTSFPHAPEAIVAWQAARDALQARPEIDGSRLGAFGVSRGGLWVMRLAASRPHQGTHLLRAGGRRLLGHPGRTRRVAPRCL